MDDKVYSLEQEKLLVVYQIHSKLTKFFLGSLAKLMDLFMGILNNPIRCL